MVRFERSRERQGRGDSKGDFRRDPSNRGNFDDKPRGRRDSGRDFKRNGGNRRDFQMTEVTCDDCGIKCEVPFKPTSSKPVFCKECFGKKENGGSGKVSSKDFDVINEKLDKIMEALKVK